MGFKNLLKESQVQLDEAFNSKPYDITMSKSPKGSDIWFNFEADGQEYRIKFQTKGGLGKKAREVILGEKVGNQFKDQVKEFPNGLKLIATMIAATEQFLETPIGRNVDGLMFHLTKKAAVRGEKVLRAIAKRSAVIRNKLTLIDAKVEVDPKRTPVFLIRKGKSAEEVFDGAKVTGLLQTPEDTPVEPTKKAEPKPTASTVEPQIAELAAAIKAAGLTITNKTVKQASSIVTEVKFDIKEGGVTITVDISDYDDGDVRFTSFTSESGELGLIESNPSPDSIEDIEYSIGNTVEELEDEGLLGGGEEEESGLVDTAQQLNHWDNQLAEMRDQLADWFTIRYNESREWSRSDKFERYKSFEVDGYSFHLEFDINKQKMHIRGGNALNPTVIKTKDDVWQAIKNVKPEWLADAEVEVDGIKALVTAARVLVRNTQRKYLPEVSISTKTYGSFLTSLATNLPAVKGLIELTDEDNDGEYTKSPSFKDAVKANKTPEPKKMPFGALWAAAAHDNDDWDMDVDVMDIANQSSEVKDYLKQLEEVAAVAKKLGYTTRTAPQKPTQIMGSVKGVRMTVNTFIEYNGVQIAYATVPFVVTQTGDINTNDQVTKVIAGTGVGSPQSVRLRNFSEKHHATLGLIAQGVSYAKIEGRLNERSPFFKDYQPLATGYWNEDDTVVAVDVRGLRGGDFGFNWDNMDGSQGIPSKLKANGKEASTTNVLMLMADFYAGKVKGNSKDIDKATKAKQAEKDAHAAVVAHAESFVSSLAANGVKNGYFNRIRNATYGVDVDGNGDVVVWVDAKGGEEQARSALHNYAFPAISALLNGPFNGTLTGPEFSAGDDSEYEGDWTVATYRISLKK